MLAPIQSASGLSWADTIVLAGQMAVERAARVHHTTHFCGGRADATDGAGSAGLAPRAYYADHVLAAQDSATVMGLGAVEWVALAARPRSAQVQQKIGYSGSWGGEPGRIRNTYFKVCMEEDGLRPHLWHPHSVLT